ncbi:DUF3422 family protein [Taklimakanibacter deserti]|uniref:DUF3422 family protein n=1 Tax=Taklimakanibacter deserti TaxID=2267839 RepID=UPI000E6582CE
MTLEPHPLRGAVLGEVHARPFAAISPPLRLLHFAFMTDAELAQRDRAAFGEFVAARGHRGPDASSKHYRVAFADSAVRWEQHAEFTTYTWELASLDTTPFARPAADLQKAMLQLPQPGPLMVAVDLHLLAQTEGDEWRKVFDPAGLVACETEAGDALVATDFHAAHDGFVRILVLDRGMSPLRAGIFVQQLLELETYRTFCLLGLPEAQRLQPVVRRIEQSLGEITAEMTRSEGLAANKALLNRLMAVAGELEAGASQSQFRFGATRAYAEIVRARLASLRERPIDGLQTMTAFMDRRLMPAMRTCFSMQDRQTDLSYKLMHAANLLRTRVDIDVEEQNGNLLKAMSERTRLQLRLQQTVEGLSIAAISYYVAGLLSYLLDTLPKEALGIDMKYVKAVMIVAVVTAITLIVLRIRRRHGEGAPAGAME